MEPQVAPKRNNAIIIEVTIGLIVIVGGYFGYTMFFASESAETVGVANVQMGKNMASFEKETKGSKLNFDVSILDSAFVNSLVDYSQTFTYSVRRGRIDPFLPIEATRPIR